MYIGDTIGSVEHKLGMVNLSGKCIRENDPFFSDPAYNSVHRNKTEVYNSPDLGIYFLSNVTDKSNVIHIIYPSGIVQPIEYNVHKFGAYRAAEMFWNGEQPQEGLYVIYNHSLFTRTEINRIHKSIHNDYLYYYGEPNDNKFDKAFETFRDEVIDSDKHLFHQNAKIRIVYFISYKDLVREGSIFYPELGFSVSLNNIFYSHRYSTKVKHRTDTLGYESFIEIVNNKDPYEEFFYKDISGDIVRIISAPNSLKLNGIYVTTTCNGRVIKNETIRNLDDSYKVGLYRSIEEAKLATYSEVDVKYKEMQITLAELSGKQEQYKLKLQETELKNKELKLKNEGLELQLSLAKEKHRSEMLSMEYKIKIDQLNNGFELAKKKLELKLINAKFKNEVEKMKLEKDVLKLKSTLDLVGTIGKLSLEKVKSHNDYIKSKRDVSISRNSNIKSIIDTGTKVVGAVASLI